MIVNDYYQGIFTNRAVKFLTNVLNDHPFDASINTYTEGHILGLEVLATQDLSFWNTHPLLIDLLFSGLVIL